MDGYPIAVRRLPGVSLPVAVPRIETPGVATRSRPRGLLLLAKAGRLALNCLFVAMMASVVIVIGPALLGFHRYVILTGSMTGTYDRGSIVFDRPVPVSSLKVGDPITYSPPHGYTSQQRVTHRIWWIGRGPGGERVFRTKGDANQKPDVWEFTLDQATQDRVLFHIPILGYLLIILSLRAFRIALIGLPALVIGMVILRGLWHEAGAEARRERLAALGWQELSEEGGAGVLPAVEGPVLAPQPVRLELHLARRRTEVGPAFVVARNRAAAALTGLHVRRLGNSPERRRGDRPVPPGRDRRRGPGVAAVMKLRVARLRPG